MKFFLDLLPVAVFCLAYYLYEDRSEAIYFATKATILASCAQVVISRLLQGRYDKMHLATLALVVVLGGLTLLLRDKEFIQWKPTLVYWVFAGVFIASRYYKGRSLPRCLMEQALDLPERAWSMLNLSWVAFFAVLGAVNLAVAYRLSEFAWVNFKLAMPFISLLFVIGQVAVIARVHGLRAAADDTAKERQLADAKPGPK